MERKEVDDRVRRVRKKLLAKKGVKPPEKPKTKKEQQQNALRKQVLKYCDEDGQFRTPIPNDLFVECLTM